jgi:hypothetical protein
VCTGGVPPHLLLSAALRLTRNLSKQINGNFRIKNQLTGGLRHFVSKLNEAEFSALLYGALYCPGTWGMTNTNTEFVEKGLNCMPDLGLGTSSPNEQTEDLSRTR